MQPYYDAWKGGHHAHSAQCVECHVEPGASQRLTHKFVALGEVWAHFTGFAGFPMARPADMPDSRCIACHPTVKPKNMPAAFSHEMHAKRGPCALCHSTTGHDVAATALQSTGVYNAANAAARATAHSAKATPGAGKADLPGHVNVVCTNCHDMAATGCPACHQPGHEPRGDCAQCHKPGPRFTFVHPTTTMPGWQSMQCRTCHPTSYTQVNCTCHKNGQPEGN